MSSWDTVQRNLCDATDWQGVRNACLDLVALLKYPDRQVPPQALIPRVAMCKVTGNICGTEPCGCDTCNAFAMGRQSHGGRPAVMWFAAEMEAKLRQNDHKGGWSGCTIRYLVDRLRKETVELEMALDAAASFDAVVGECADVANFALMIADNAKHLPRPGGRPKRLPQKKRRALKKRGARNRHV